MRKETLSLLFFVLLVTTVNPAWAQTGTVHSYGIPEKPWSESFGNHRALLQVSRPAQVVSFDFKWRRSDDGVDQKYFLIVNAANGDTVKNIRRIAVDNEHCQLQFGPVKEKGTYYFYYLPYQVQLGGGFYSGNYLKPEPTPEPLWLEKAVKARQTTVAKVMGVEARTQFDSFYPMEVSATVAETDSYRAKQPTALFLFPEDRKFPIRMRAKLPLVWMKHKQGQEFCGAAAPNEYYAFQIGVWADKAELQRLAYKASDLRSGSNVIPASSVTCFNLEGIDPYGKAFSPEVNVAQGTVQALWFGVDVPKQVAVGEYTGTVTVSDANGVTGVVPLRIKVQGTILPDRGDSEPWRHSRLRWLNSTLGIADTPTQPYTPMTVNGNIVGCLGRTVSVDETSMLPEQIKVGNTQILQHSLSFTIETSEGVKALSAVPQLEEQTVGHVRGIWKAEDTDLSVRCEAVMEFDGWINYVYTLTPKKKINIKDVRLEICMRNEVACYFLGAGLPGQDTPMEYEGKWDTPEKTVNHFGVSIPTDKQQQWLWPFDSFWMGNAHAGIHCELRGSSYTGPLLNSYRPAYPESWYNGGKGGFVVKRGDEATKVTVYSGARTVQADQILNFDFALIVTPVKPVDMKAQFVNRYYHNGSKPVPTDEDVKAGVRIINVHHANEYNPFINYPFLTVDKVKAFTAKWHEKGCKVKLYYTLRELTSATTEIWAIRSLGHEILRGGNGGGFPWCREHLGSDYTPQWYQHFEHMDDTGITADAALLTSESNSRWYNYYVEGLRWMVENMGIDGIYLDDVSFDRRILKRMRRAMETVKPGCMIDLHSNTGFSKGPANQYTEFFPFVDKLWFGESFLYDHMTPTNYLVESSGIPFGLTGDMLYRGGNQWLGMQYGMTVRHPWLTEGVVCDPRVVWKIWDDFGIQDSKMTGFWESDVPVTTSDERVKVTVYEKEGGVLLSVGNYSDEVRTVRLNIDWQRLGMDAEMMRLVAPEISTFQSAKVWNVQDNITVKPRKGWLIYIIRK